MIKALLLVSTCALAALSCGNPAVDAGVGRECAADDDCDDDQSCLDFAGGYCGIEDCDADDDCPGGSACVAHTDGNNYCFLLCVEKGECNVDRSGDNEANCVGNITFVESEQNEAKACVPPSSG